PDAGRGDLAGRVTTSLWFVFRPDAADRPGRPRYGVVFRPDRPTDPAVRDLGSSSGQTQQTGPAVRSSLTSARRNAVLGLPLRRAQHPAPVGEGAQGLDHLGVRLGAAQ